MENLIKRVEQQLKNNWAVSKEDIQAMLDYIKQNQQNHEKSH